MNPAQVLLHQIRVRPRLLTATIVGFAMLAMLPPSLSLTTRELLAWDVGAGLYLTLAWIMMLRANVERMRRRADLTLERRRNREPLRVRGGRHG